VVAINREEFIIVGYTEPERFRPHIGALLLGYYDDAGRLVYAGRVGTGMSAVGLRRLYGVLLPLRIPKMPLDTPPPRTSRFGTPLELSRVHWVMPQLVCEVRGDKPAREVRRERPAWVFRESSGWFWGVTAAAACMRGP